MSGNRLPQDGAVYLFTKLLPQIKTINKGYLKEPRQKLMGLHDIAWVKIKCTLPLLSDTVENFWHLITLILIGGKSCNLTVK